MWAALSLVNNHVYEKATLPILIRALGHESSILRRVACLSLGLIPYEPAEKDVVVPTLAETAGRDPDEQVRQAARSALNIIAPEIVGQPRATP
jgi:HEAT repeat protein